MVDCQNTYVDGPMQLVGVDQAMDEAQRVLDRARAAGTPIIHIAHDAGAGSPYDIQAATGRIADQVAPIGDEPTIHKNYPNSFTQTDLHDRLQKLGISNLIVVGFMSHMCVSSTARGAFDLGYRTTVVAEATATRDLPSTTGQTLKAADLHEASLAGLRDLVAVVVNTADDLPTS